MKIRALGTYLFIERLDGYGEYSLLAPNRSLDLDRIVLPETWRAKGQVGRVLSVGRGSLTRRGLQPLEVKVGDLVLFNPIAGSEIRVDHKPILVIDQSEVLALL